jgi:DNA-directed RNA polymerase subunit omega
VSGTVANPTGITDPPIDDLLEVADSKYALVIYAAKRARQINAYYAQLNEGLLEYVGPLVETAAQEKPLSIAMREINRGLLRVHAATPEATLAPASPAEGQALPPALLDDLIG